MNDLRKRVTIGCAAIVAMLATAIQAAPPANADPVEPGNLYMTGDLDKYSCGAWDVMTCFDFRVRVDPAGWHKKHTLTYYWDYLVDGDRQDSDQTDCYYTDGSTCTRWSPTWTLGPMGIVHQHHVCIRVRAQQVIAPQQSANLTKKVCYDTVPGVPPARGR